MGNSVFGCPIEDTAKWAYFWKVLSTYYENQAPLTCFRLGTLEIEIFRITCYFREAWPVNTEPDSAFTSIRFCSAWFSGFAPFLYWCTYDEKQDLYFFKVYYAGKIPGTVNLLKLSGHFCWQSVESPGPQIGTGQDSQRGFKHWQYDAYLSLKLLALY